MDAATLRADEQTRWQEIESIQQELKADPPVGQNSVEFETPIEAKLHAAAGAFARDFPESAHRWDAALLELKTVFFPAPADERRPIFKSQEEKLSVILGSSSAHETIRNDAERAVVSQHLDHLDLVATPAEALALEGRLLAIINKNPNSPKVGAQHVRRVDLIAKSDPARADALLNTLAADPNPVIANLAKGRLEQKALGSAPLDWSFTDVAGNPFRADQYRGKVTIVEFWATWCPDCLRELPKVIEAYNRYHARGLEVIGVSLDKKKDALTSFIKKRNMPWPQYFDGKGWDTALAIQYGVRGIPEMWLVDKTGRVVATGLHGDDLDQRIATLLGE